MALVALLPEAEVPAVALSLVVGFVVVPLVAGFVVAELPPVAELPLVAELLLDGEVLEVPELLPPVADLLDVGESLAPEVAEPLPVGGVLGLTEPLPDLPAVVDPDPDPAPEPEAEPDPEPDAAAKPEPEAEPESDPEPETEESDLEEPAEAFCLAESTKPSACSTAGRPWALRAMATIWSYFSRPARLPSTYPIATPAASLITLMLSPPNLSC